MSAAIFLSGASALAYQSLWLRSFSLIFGGSTQAASLVLATFMAGLALGNSYLQLRPASRVLRAYAFAEMGMGLSALLALPLLRALPLAYGTFLSRHALPAGPELLVKAFLAAALVFPTTFLSGLTLPLALEYLTRQGRGLAAQFGRLYQLNTLGAALGVLLATFVLLPQAGLSASLALAAGLNLGLGAVAWWLSRGEEALRQAPGGLNGPALSLPKEPALSLPKEPALSLPKEPALSLPKGFAVFPHGAAALLGASAFLLELLWTRAFSLVIGSSVYAFNLMLLAMLLGIVLGAWLYQGGSRRWKNPGRALGWALLALGLALPLQLMLIGTLPALFVGLMRTIPLSFAAHQTAGFALCFLAMLPVTSLQGLIFPLLVESASGSGRPAQVVSSGVYAFNTWGAVAGALAAGFVLIPAFGLQANFMVAAAPALILGLWLLGREGVFERALAPVLWSGLALALALLLLRFRPWDPYAVSSAPYLYGKQYKDKIPPGQSYGAYLRGLGELVFYREGREALVTARTYGGIRSLQVNGKTDASYGPDSVTQKLFGHLPLMIHPAPGTALVIGWGSGTTAASVSLYPLKRLDCVELEPATFEAAAWFDQGNRGLRPGGIFSLFFQDGRNFMLKSPLAWDLIISEPSNPWIHGMSSLFTLDYYQVAKARLAPGGIFAQWFHFYAMQPQDLRSEFQTFCRAFPHASLWMVPRLAGGVTGDLLFLGSLGPHALDYPRLDPPFSDPRIGSDLKGVGIDGPLALAGTYVMDRADMLAYAGQAPLNTDELPGIEFSAPKSLYHGAEQSQALTLANCLEFDAASTSGLPPLSGWPSPKLGRPARAGAYLRLARSYFQMHMPRKAQRLLLLSLAELPGQREVAVEMEGIGKFHYAAQRYEDSRALYQAMAAAFPRDPEASFGLGASLARLRDWRGARAALLQCLKLAPGHSQAGLFLRQMEENIRSEGG